MTVTQPAIFISHGGGPCFSMEVPGDPFRGLRTYLEGLIDSLPQRPRAILMISAHWDEDVVTVGSTATPDMIYDYYGFPPHTYHIRHDAAGDPSLAAEVIERLRGAGIMVAENAQRGFDHGTFVPMMIIDPPAGIPIVTLSLRRDLDPAAHIAVGKALAPLRAENVLILGSGNSFHNLSTFMNGQDAQSSAFDSWLTEAMLDPATRETALAEWDQAPGARASHPEPDHLLPLMVIAGAASGEPATVDFHGKLLGKTISGYRLG
ncbi:DODA-type extradiol aromatic ring-opening family dioxygenase [Novosphingobium sp. BL-52-GroH]|uniref:DODA-type extradiol aromatic ring-opening family dioxygenase n=1 Tax=Novosphingobium sp. BL-52-GroH TaxID=3349877 RepID=UPI0038502EDC